MKRSLFSPRDAGDPTRRAVSLVLAGIAAVVGHVLADDEALDRQARLQDQRRMLQRDRLAVVAADHSAQGDPPERVHAAADAHRHDDALGAAPLAFDEGMPDDRSADEARLKATDLGA